MKQESFRPLAGIMVLIEITSYEYLKSATRFPSPCGDYGSYRMPCKINCLSSCQCFRPLAGIMVLIYYAECCGYGINCS